MTYPKQSTGDAAQQPNGAAAEVSPSPRLPEVEQRVLAFWKADDTFRESIRRREGEAEWVFN
ncbi:hypothetical protein BMH30_04010, partial [Leucobacter sp. OLES1]